MFRHHSTGIALVVALALAAAAPSAVSARPFEPIAPPATSQAQASPAIDPHSGDAAIPPFARSRPRELESPTHSPYETPELAAKS